MLSLRGKALLVKLFYENEESVSLALRSYRKILGMKKRAGDSDRTEVYDKKFEETGCLEERKKTSGKSVDVVQVVEQDADRQSTSSAIKMNCIIILYVH